MPPGGGLSRAKAACSQPSRSASTSAVDARHRAASGWSFSAAAVAVQQREQPLAEPLHASAVAEHGRSPVVAADLRFFVNVGTLGRRTPGTAVVDVPALNTGTINPASGGIRFNDAGADVTGDVMDGPEVTPNGRILTDHASIQRRNP